MSLASQKATTEYQEAIQSTEDLESPAVGFAKTSDYKGGLTNEVNIVIKQNNTLLYLATKQSQKLVELEEKFDKLKQEIHTIKEREVQPADLEDSISSLAKRLDSVKEMTSRRPSILNRSSTQTQTELPTQEDQIRGYRQMAQNRHQVARTTRRVFGRSNYNRTLETAVDPERQLEISRERRANLVPAEVLYSNNRRLQQYPLGRDIHDKAGYQTPVIWEIPIQPRKRRGPPHQQTGITTIPVKDMSDPTNQDDHSKGRVRNGQHLGNHRENGIIMSGVDVPTDITPKRISCKQLGWGDEFSDDEVHQVKLTILEERTDWDDDERSGGKVLVIQERMAQNQQEFLDEYLPQWDENLAIQKEESESKWENPFAAKSGENHNHTILHLSKEENDDDDLPYPKFRNFKQMAAKIIKKHEEHAFPSSSSQIESTQSYQPPHDSIMGPPVYPPAQQNPQPFYRPDYQFGYPQGKSKIFNGGYGEYYNSQWTLPPAWTESRVMLVLPSDPGLWSEVISRWESITINRLNNQTWSDNKAKLAFVENLLEESEQVWPSS
ncbi:hypothetical protein Tco_0001637 [Tanacetum coccineum]